MRLADTIREHGGILPICVEETEGYYILHDGERRLRAAKLAGLETIPANIGESLNGTAPRSRLERALVANLHSAGLDPINEAKA